MGSGATRNSIQSALVILYFWGISGVFEIDNELKLYQEKET